MKQLIGAGLLILGSLVFAHAEAVNDSSLSNKGRYQMFSSPHANRVYVLDTQSGRVYQLANYKDAGKEILEEVPYVYGSTRLCSPSEYERSPEKCFTRNYEYMKGLLDIRREQTTVQPAQAPAEAPATKLKK